MKKFLFVFLCVLFVTEVSAQRFRKTTSYGLKEGIIVSQISGDLHKGFRKFSMIMGAYVERSVSRDFSFQVEAVYEEKGSRWTNSKLQKELLQKEDTLIGSHGYQLRLHYIAFPILANFDSGIEGIDVQGGLSYGLLTYVEEIETTLGVNSFPNVPAFKNGDLTYIIGLRTSFASKFGLLVRFSRSILTVRDYIHTDETSFFKPGQQNTSLSFALSYQFVTY
jgi:hypothetical protein